MGQGHAYYIIYKERSKGGELGFYIGGRGRDSLVIKLQGKSIKRVFHDTLSVLSQYGGIIPVEVTDSLKTYAVREDLGPVIGAYLLTLRRARNYNKWHRFLKKLMNDEYPGVAIVLSNFLQIALELSKAWRNFDEKGDSRKAYDIVSSVLKHFINKLRP